MTVSRDDVLQWLSNCARVIAEKRDYLIELDAAIGDADHGANMDRGFQAVLKKLPELADKDIGAIFKTAGMTLVSTVGGAGGPLYGTFFLQAGAIAAGKTELSLADWTAALEAAIHGVMARGKASPGDKTMLDALLPALEALKKSADPRRRARTGAAGFGGGCPAGDAGYHPAGGAQREGQLPGRAQRRAPGPRRHIFIPAAPGGGRHLDAAGWIARGRSGMVVWSAW